MAMIAQPDFSNDQEQTFGVIPPGRYPFEVVKDDYKATRAGTGYYAEYQLRIAEGPHAGRLLFVNFNLENPNPKAVEIGRSQFKAFAKAVGHPNPNMIRDTSELLMKRGVASVIVTGTEQEGNQRNEVKAFFPAGHLLGQPGMNGAPTYQPAAGMAAQAIAQAPIFQPPAPSAPSVQPTAPIAPPTASPAPVGNAPAAPAPAAPIAAAPPQMPPVGQPAVPQPAAADPFTQAGSTTDPFDNAGIPAWT